MATGGIISDSNKRPCEDMQSPEAVNSKKACSDNATFFVVQSTDTSRKLSDLSPFVIEKVLQGSLGTVKSCKKLRQGGLLIEVSNSRQAASLHKLNKFFDIPIEVSSHRSLNTCKGVIYSPDLMRSSDTEIIENLSGDGVTAVSNIMSNRNGSKQRSPLFVLTFDSTTLPACVKAGYLMIRVKPYIPNPLRCFKCQRFGHHQSNCKNSEKCAKCGEEAHLGSECTKPVCCVNCSQSHTSFSRDCPKFVSEKQICEIKVLKGVSYPEARRLQNLPTASSSSSYAAAAATGVKKTFVSIETQTLAICKCTQTIDVVASGDKIIIPRLHKISTSTQGSQASGLPPRSVSPSGSWAASAASKGPSGPDGEAPLVSVGGARPKDPPPSGRSVSIDRSSGGRGPRTGVGGNLRTSGGRQSRSPRKKIDYP